MFKHDKYYILTPELYHPGKSFDEKFCICETCCHRHLYKNEIQCQAVSNKMTLYPIPDELNDFKKIKEVFISRRTLFKKITIIHGKLEFSKTNKLQIYAICYQRQQFPMD